ncbi:MAG: TRAP transporter large permease subunit, partial [Burkholderiaceae bacterium]
DTPVAITLLVPLFVPQALEQGINPVHLGLVLCFNLCIGLITPPLGKCLVVTAAVTGMDYWRLVRASLPFVAVLVGLLIFLVVVPEVTLYLPRWAGLFVG